ncbi:hypothetical protein EUTSA_v10012914mg [Eutrema salsugineum]|uniref:Phorbol-ester/DAG-type domain-containing protein n=1 Tax=Eutrema salsugineum TaxID=72664 RepID=V4NC66_EUTSA|nr:uncharacterized protein LOC18018010 [Eutrema salsugineum]ESQ43521.1 hypothetical protein EUTSA_v10012914mg [Eutrema salsugineum]
MSSVGVFRKVDVDEKSYWVYTLTQTDNPASSTETPPSTSFFCPSARVRFLKLKLKENNADDVYRLHPVISPAHFPSTRSGNQQGESLLDCNHDKICKLPVVHLNDVDDEFKCGICRSSWVSTSYYACLQCQEKFHKECVESPPEIRHPSHPFHPLRLYREGSGKECNSCEESIYTKLYYQCTTCKLFMHPRCAMKSIPFIEDHPKSHPHPLSYFPTQASLVCHICGMINNLDPTYICIQCIFVIHKKCLGFPRAIRISRHHQRLSFTPSLPPGKLFCGVCHRQVDNNYGAYSCSKGEAFFAHSKCALDKKVWDGKVLDEVPEEDDIIDDGEPFKRIADGIILHPFHSHNLHLEISEAYDENKLCRGCCVAIYEGQFYSCMECDYILHESCANAPRMKRHPLHPYPLTLNVATIGPDNNEGIFRCSVCSYYGTGFFYKHQIGETRFQLDLRCASITQPFHYQGHKHPLFLPLEPRPEARCQTCKYQSYSWKVNCCIECDYMICFRCATLPYKVKYKHDSHFLTICDGKEASDEPDWCEICEGKIEAIEERVYYGNQTKELRFYKCDDCCRTLHVECLLGVNIYMKPGNTINDYVYFTKYSFETECTEWIKVRILLNSSLSRPICTGCNRRCPFPVVYQQSENEIFCSWDCIGYATW